MTRRTLAKRATKTARDSNAAVGMNPAAAPEREYVPFEDDSRGDREEISNGEERAAGAMSAGEGKTEKPSMQEIFGPGGFLEKCMYGGYEHRQGQLEMAEMVHDAFETHHHAIVEAGTGTGKTLHTCCRRSAARDEWLFRRRRSRCKNSFTRRTFRSCKNILRRN